MATQQLYRRDLKPGDTYGASLNDATPTFRVDEDGDTIDLRNGAVRYHGLSTMVHHVIRAATPSTPPAPVRKGRVGMRLKGHRSGREFTIASNVGGHLGDYWNTTSADGVEGVVCDDDIGTTWLIAPTDTRAEAVRLRRRDLNPGDRFSVDQSGSESPWVVVDDGRDRHDDGMLVTALHDLHVYNVIRAPVATPEVVRRDDLQPGDTFAFPGMVGSRWLCTGPNRGRSATKDEPDGAIASHNCLVTDVIRADGTVPPASWKSPPPMSTGWVLPAKQPMPTINPTALRRYEGAQQAEGTKYMRDADRREGSAAFTAAVSLRLAARAEERRLREQLACQPNYAGGDDVDE
jgi:hypothetical protein